MCRWVHKLRARKVVAALLCQVLIVPIVCRWYYVVAHETAFSAINLGAHGNPGFGGRAFDL